MWYPSSSEYEFEINVEVKDSLNLQRRSTPAPHLPPRILGPPKLLFQPWQGPVAMRRHHRQLRAENQDRGNQVAKEEPVWSESTMRSFIGKPIEKEQRCRCIECARHKRHNGPGTGRKGICDVERRDENKCAAQCQEEVAENVAIEAGQYPFLTCKNLSTWICPTKATCQRPIT